MSKKCRALYPYTKHHTNEISFEAGDVIEDVVEHEDGWWSGMVNGQLGVFPNTYVELLQEEFVDQGGDSLQEITVRACYDYSGKTPNELSIKKGDVFIVNEKDAEGKWWHGVYTEPSLRKGWFPAQYVEEIDPSMAHVETLEEYAEEHHLVDDTGYDNGWNDTTTTTTTTTTYQPQPPQQPRPQIPQQPRPPQQPMFQPQPPVIPQNNQPQPPPVGSKPEIPQQVQKDPPPMKPVKVEKAAKGVVAYLDIQIHGATGLPADTKAAQVVVAVKEGDKGKLRKAFKTEAIKRDFNPFWMEAFQVNVMDPEDSDLVVQLVDGKKTMGEVTVPLRSTKRAPLEAYGGIDKTYNLPAGTLHFVVSYRDVNAPSKPKNFKKDESIVMSQTASGFDLSKASTTWQQKFVEAGLEIASDELPSYTPPAPVGPKPTLPQLHKPAPPQVKPHPPQQQPFQPQPPQQPKPPQMQPQPPKPKPQPPQQPAFRPQPPQQPQPPQHPQQPQFRPPPPQQPRPPQQQQPQPPMHPKPPPFQNRPQPPQQPHPHTQHPPQFQLTTQHHAPTPGGGGGGAPSISPRPPPPRFDAAPRTTVTPLPVQGGVGRMPPPIMRGGPPPLPARED